MTKAVKDGNVYQVPVDGKSLTDIHRNGVKLSLHGQLAAFFSRKRRRKGTVDNTDRG
jgi:hypothetical protein